MLHMVPVQGIVNSDAKFKNIILMQEKLAKIYLVLLHLAI
jgi:hypothetical protein